MIKKRKSKISDMSTFGRDAFFREGERSDLVLVCFVNICIYTRLRRRVYLYVSRSTAYPPYVIGGLP